MLEFIYPLNFFPELKFLAGIYLMLTSLTACFSLSFIVPSQGNLIKTQKETQSLLTLFESMLFSIGLHQTVA